MNGTEARVETLTVLKVGKPEILEELRKYNIRVTVICPGSTATELSPHEGKDPRKMLQPEDVARVVEMVVTQSPQSFASEIVLRPTQKP